MSALSMRLDEAKAAILDGNFDHGVDLCLSVLSSFPKHMEAHCLLGEALREKGFGEQAELVFLRVLSADPENLIARWALSILLEERGDAAEALYHLERAFELSSGHSDLRSELARLSGQPVSLNRLALARVYMRGGEWEKAVDELGVVLQRNPGCLEVMVPMVEALWRLSRTGDTRRADDARALCEKILDDSPDCLKANIILGRILLADGAEGRTRVQPLRIRVQALDPEGEVEADLIQGLEEELLLGLPESHPLWSDRDSSTSTQAESSSAGLADSDADELAGAAGSGEQTDESGAEWDDLLGGDVAVDEETNARLSEAIVFFARSRREVTSGRSVLASVEASSSWEAEADTAEQSSAMKS